MVMDYVCCVGLHGGDRETRPWKPWEQYMILAYSDHDNELAEVHPSDHEQSPASSLDDVDNRVDPSVSHASKSVQASELGCSTSLEQSLNELQLMRVELRGRDDQEERLLYLGDVHTDRAQRPYYRPQSYQQPLVADDTTHVCQHPR